MRNISENTMKTLTFFQEQLSHPIKNSKDAIYFPLLCHFVKFNPYYSSQLLPLCWAFVTFTSCCSALMPHYPTLVKVTEQTKGTAAKVFSTSGRVGLKTNDEIWPNATGTNATNACNGNDDGRKDINMIAFADSY